MKSDAVITVKNVTKRFPIPLHYRSTILARATSGRLLQTLLCKKQESKTVLDSVSLTVGQGEIVGVIGRNSSGKTTLLQIIAGIMLPNSGEVQTTGSIIPLLNLGAGLMPQLTVHDNIRLLCFLYGMSCKQVDQIVDVIIEFAQLEEYVSMRPNQLSRGMLQRLVFAVAVHTSPDILLLDEVFAAGDTFFCDRAIQKMETLIHSNTTVVMASHHLALLQKIAHRIIWIEEGKIVKEGQPDRVIQAYKNS